MDKTKAYGALSPGLAAQLDRLADRGRRDRLLHELGRNPAQYDRHPPGADQLALLTQSEDGDTLISFEGETL